jgi:hypothetical protein
MDNSSTTKKSILTEISKYKKKKAGRLRARLFGSGGVP